MSVWLPEDARRPAAPAQPAAAGVVQLLQAWRVQTDLQLPRPLRLVAGGWMTPQTAQGPELGDGAPPPPAWLADTRRQHRDVSARSGGGHPLPLPGHPHPRPLGEHPRRKRITAGPVERRMPEDSLVRCVGRAGETGRERSLHRAPGTYSGAFPHRSANAFARGDRTGVGRRRRAAECVRPSHDRVHAHRGRRDADAREHSPAGGPWP